MTFSAGRKTIVPPWEEMHSRFTLLFEAFAVEVLKACRTVPAAAALLCLFWDAAQRITDRAVERRPSSTSSSTRRPSGRGTTPSPSSPITIAPAFSLSFRSEREPLLERSCTLFQSSSGQECVPSPPTGSALRALW
jgi:hypothetical protein